MKMNAAKSLDQTQLIMMPRRWIKKIERDKKIVKMKNEEITSTHRKVNLTDLEEIKMCFQFVENGVETMYNSVHLDKLSCKAERNEKVIL